MPETPTAADEYAYMLRALPGLLTDSDRVELAALATATGTRPGTGDR